MRMKQPWEINAERRVRRAEQRHIFEETRWVAHDVILEALQQANLYLYDELFEIRHSFHLNGTDHLSQCHHEFLVHVGIFGEDSSAVWYGCGLADVTVYSDRSIADPGVHFTQNLLDACALANNFLGPE